jgi:hypothetical protein
MKMQRAVSTRTRNVVTNTMLVKSTYTCPPNILLRVASRLPIVAAHKHPQHNQALPRFEHLCGSSKSRSAACSMRSQLMKCQTRSTCHTSQPARLLIHRECNTYDPTACGDITTTPFPRGLPSFTKRRACLTGAPTTYCHNISMTTSLCLALEDVPAALRAAPPGPVTKPRIVELRQAHLSPRFHRPAPQPSPAEPSPVQRPCEVAPPSKWRALRVPRRSANAEPYPWKTCRPPFAPRPR